MPAPYGKRDDSDPEEVDETAPEPRVESERGEVPAVLRAGRDLRERLALLENGDPLQMAARSQRKLRADALFLNPSRLYLRCLARAAFASSLYDGDPPLDAWLDDLIEISISDLLREQEAEENARVPVASSPDADYYALFAQISRIPAKYGRLACLTMNQLPREDRLTFIAIVVEGKTINRWVAQGHGPPHKVQQRLRIIGLKIRRVLKDAERRDAGGADGR